MLTDEEIMAQVLAAFQEEQDEHRQTATDILLELEREPDHPRHQELLDQLFREAHSLKGGARAAGLDAVEQIAHRMEDVFSAVRQGKLQLTPEVCDSIYAGMDAIGAMMTQVAAGHPPNLEPHQAILDTLSHILGETVEKTAPHATARKASVATPPPPPGAEKPPHSAPPPARKSPPPPAPSASDDLVAATSLTVAAQEEPWQSPAPPHLVPGPAPEPRAPARTSRTTTGWNQRRHALGRRHNGSPVYRNARPPVE
ncbi:MAG: hypothetical protein HC884_00055 [Chloroflexaceae bacterium]|nr:hypothetical protein [Chloroflexaceae bacterium]